MNANSSVTLGLGQLMLNGEPLELYEYNGYTVIKVVGDDTRIIIIDPETGIVRDILRSNISGWINGAYCYSDQQAEMANGVSNATLGNKDAINRAMETGEAVATDFGQGSDEWQDELLGLGSSMAISVGMAVMLLGGPPGWIIGGLMIAAGMAGSYYAADLDEGWTTSRWINFGLTAGPALIPFFGWEGGVAGRLGISYFTSNGGKKLVTTVAGNYEGYVITNMPRWAGGTFVGGYMSSVEYVKYGTTKSIIRTAFGDTKKEAVENALEDLAFEEGQVFVNIYSPEIDQYSSTAYNNLSEYLATA